MANLTSEDLIKLSIFEKPYPYLAMRSVGSRTGNLRHEWKSACLPSRLTMSFSHEAQLVGKAFFVNIASGSSAEPSYFITQSKSVFTYIIVRRDNKKLTFFSRLLNRFLEFSLSL